MLISPFHLPTIDRNHPAYRVLITNLEEVAVSFRVRFTLSTGTDDDRLAIVRAYCLLEGFTSASVGWVRAKPDLYTCSATVTVKPGRTGDISLRANDQTGQLGYLFRTNGYAEIFLPPVEREGGLAAALDHPAHIMLAAMHVVGDKGSLVDGNQIRTLPDGYPGPIALASGRAEHFLPPDQPRVIAKRVAPSRAQAGVKKRR